MSSNIECYSVRQLSPFIGNIQIVQANYCRALSSDGIIWQIQASCETHQQAWGIFDDEYVPRRYVLYGSWDRKNGFSHLPLDPMLDVPDIRHVNDTLISTLKENLHRLPFQQRDNFECWMLDKHTSLPLALLASTINQQMIQHIQPGPWQAIPQQIKNESRALLSESDISTLEAGINKQSKQHCWYQRLNDGSGRLLSDHQHLINSDQFPELLINTELLAEPVRDIANQYIKWQSPRLLSLQFLQASTRHTLEQSAQHYAVDTHRRLSIYPEPLSQHILNKIKVELKIRGQ